MNAIARFRSLQTALPVAVFAALVLLAAAPAWAHKVNVYAYAEGDTVQVRGYFSKNPAKNCTVIVFLSDGTKLLEGATDDNGEFSFRATVRADLRIQIVAGEGHTNSYTIKAAELPESLPGPDGVKETATPPESATPAPPGHPEPAGTPPVERSLQANSRQIEEIVEKVVERKIAPLRKMLLEQQERAQGATFEKAIAGLGIIFGLMGLTMYLRSIWRDRRDKTSA